MYIILCIFSECWQYICIFLSDFSNSPLLHSAELMYYLIVYLPIQNLQVSYNEKHLIFLYH